MNLLILAGVLATCLFVASFITSHKQVAIVDSDPLQSPKKTGIIMSHSSEPTQVELTVNRISISKHFIKLEINNPTGVALSAVKGQVSFLNKQGDAVYDVLQMRNFQPFSAYKMEGLVGPYSKTSITIEMNIPDECKKVLVSLKETSHADGTLTYFTN